MKRELQRESEFDLDKFLPYLLNQAAEVTSQNFQKVYRSDYGMTRAQWRVMANLGKHGSMTATEICRITFIEKTKMSRAVQNLHEKGYLSRDAIAGDRRSERLSLTANGNNTFLALGKKAAEFDLQLRKRLGREGVDQLEKVLRDLIQSAA